MSNDNSNSPRSYEIPSLSTGVYLLLDKSKATVPGSPLDLGPRETLLSHARPFKWISFYQTRGRSSLLETASPWKSFSSGLSVEPHPGNMDSMVDMMEKTT